MSVKEITLAIGKGVLDSFKGVYWLWALDSVQRKAHQSRQDQQFQQVSNRESSKKVGANDVTKKKNFHISNKEEPRLLNRVIQCCGLNGFVFLASILLFKNVVLPLLQTVLTLITTSAMMTTTTSPFWSWLQFLLHLTFDSLWVLPLFILSRIVNALWFQDIGTLAYRYSLGRPKGVMSLSAFIADNVFSFIIQALFLVQAFVLSHVLTPLLGHTPSTLIFLVHTSLLYSLYSFEYKWVQLGMPLHQRLTYLEQNWPYFLGFGLPLSLLTYWPADFVVSGCLFAIFFPVFIVSGNEGEVYGNSGTIYCPRLKLFQAVVVISNWGFVGVGDSNRGGGGSRSGKGKNQGGNKKK